MSGWVKLDKELPQSIRFQRVMRKLRASNDSNALLDVTRCDDALLQSVTLGALARVWFYADSHIDDDNTLEATADEIDALVGVPGFASALPPEWLVILPDGRIQLPDFLEKNGTSAKQRKDGARRQAEFRHRHKAAADETLGNDSNALRNASNDARPDQTRPDKTEDIQTAAVQLDLTTTAPAKPAKRRARGKSSSAPMSEFHEAVVAAYRETCPTLPSVAVWTRERLQLLEERVQERCAAGKPADTVEYWRGFFENVAASDFLCGRVPGRPWRANFQWLLEPEPFRKVMEGNYDNNKTNGQSSSRHQAYGGAQ